MRKGLLIVLDIGTICANNSAYMPMLVDILTCAYRAERRIKNDGFWVDKMVGIRSYVSLVLLEQPTHTSR